MPEICPYCLEPFTDANPSTRDHVFLESFGGYAKIDACSNCNSDEFGSKVEGKLQGPNTLGAFVRHVSGDATKRFDATVTSTGKKVSVDLVTSEVRAKRPVEVDRADPTRVTYSVEGSEAQVRDVLDGVARKYGLSEEEVDRVVESGVSQQLESFEVELSLDLSLSARSGAKVAIGALVLARGPEAAQSPLASHLRGIAQGTTDLSALLQVATDPLDLVLDYADSADEGISPGSSFAAFIDDGANGTVVYTRLAGQLTPPFGFHLAEPVPEKDAIATIVEDAPHQARVVEVAAAMARAAAELAQQGDAD